MAENTKNKPVPERMADAGRPRGSRAELYGTAVKGWCIGHKFAKSERHFLHNSQLVDGRLVSRDS